MSRRWTTLVASGLERRTGAPVEVVRFGVPGAGPQLELRVGGRLVVMIIPDELQVDGDVFARTVAHAGTRGADHELEWPQRALGEALATRGIPVLDLLPASRLVPSSDAGDGTGAEVSRPRP